jgi:hypothetical protein
LGGGDDFWSAEQCFAKNPTVTGWQQVRRGGFIGKKSLKEGLAEFSKRE